jgi:hypothetical protein
LIGGVRGSGSRDGIDELVRRGRNGQVLVIKAVQWEQTDV